MSSTAPTSRSTRGRNILPTVTDESTRQALSSDAKPRSTATLVLLSAAVTTSLLAMVVFVVVWSRPADSPIPILALPTAPPPVSPDDPPPALVPTGTDPAPTTSSSGEPTDPDGGAPTAPPPTWNKPVASAVTPAGDGTFNRGAATAAMAEAASRAKTCKRPRAPTGPSRATVVFLPEGKPATVTVDSPYTGTPTGACVIALFRAVRVPPFTGANMPVSKSFVIP